LLIKLNYWKRARLAWNLQLEIESREQKAVCTRAIFFGVQGARGVFVAANGVLVFLGLVKFAGRQKVGREKST